MTRRSARAGSDLVRKTEIKRHILGFLSCAAAVGMTVPACGESEHAPSAACNDSTTSTTEPGPSSDTVVVTASGTICGGRPLEVLVIREPSETDTMGQQVQRDRYAIIGSVEPGKFDVRIPIGPVVQLRDGSELRPASDKFEVGFR
ncbi:MAG: hypothetical protein ABI577_06925 [bacterium]